MSDEVEQQDGALVPEQPPEDPELALAWLTERWGSLSERQYKYLAAYRGDNVADAASAASVGSSAVRNWRSGSEVFRAAEGFIREGRKGVMAGLALARLERASLEAAEKLIAIATSDPDTARGESARITALNSLLDRVGLAPSKPGVAVSVSIDNRRLDALAIGLWNERLARGEGPAHGPTLVQRQALQAPADDGDDLDPVVEEEAEAKVFQPTAPPRRVDPPVPTEEERLLCALDPFDLRPKEDLRRGGRGF